ncbi:adenylate/guanylate cyclase domain-containing protein [Leptospira wolffii]|uniref:adenylate/guanylate cyclase domain-containing protein n=1 Tax=Leptospira wolffii TaxID=409998 RepID=UPI001082B71A|nr:adenylate/guanylate cyclase domain-containing protein [Leptospira wolffii]TGK56115.1 adenylate/guanylate cyclase domain-containing protein [Leptospira wolffii]TGK72161.1 adenylate/guanylate cyclase domain-containing protein [Leptospira wolffii]TGK77465.1 adenylate/guanylate cyclase domain-containing protein [Leptospira wolffii]TGL27738.1 adenylate/guanylate cyclase domain-containing protein [Leptospira wolffii]
MSESKTASKITLLDIVFGVTTLLGILGHLYFAFFPYAPYSDAMILFGALLLFTSSYFFYKTIVKFGKDRQAIGSLWLAVIIAFVWFDLYSYFDPARNVEEASISWRFYLRSNDNARKESENEEGRMIIKRVPYPKARNDINIIGITTESLEKLGGVWPISWEYYAKIINVFSESTNHLMFDIFLLDYKPGQTEAMAKALAGNPRVMFDYPMETSLESREAIQNLDKRVQILQKFRLENVQDDSSGSWLRFPQPPIEPIAEKASGLGFANIKKDASGLNRKMPIVARIYESGKGDEATYYPSIDLIIACNYFGVDVKKDTEVVMGKYVKIKNIPQKTKSFFDRTTLKWVSEDIMAVPNEKREITIPIDDDGQMEINFPGGLFAYNNFEIFDVAETWDKETPKQTDNNIYLVAMYYATGRGTAKDTHLSPFGDMSGIEHHAHAINTILNQDFLWDMPLGGNFLIYLFMAFLIGLVLPRLKTSWGFLFIILIALIYSVASAVDFLVLNIVHLFPTVVFEQFSIFVAIIGYKILTEEENVKYIRTTFSKFVSKDVVDELLKNPENLNLGGSKKDITIFFSDIRGFTTMSEKMGPEELVQFLNQYLSEMTEIIIEFKGTIDKYMGDAIMAFWGAPVPLEDHAYYACAASIAQMRRLAVLKEEWKSRDLPVMDIGIGLNSGPAVVGNMGSSHRMDYTCMGDTINLGSRLEGSNKEYGTNIIISEYTYEKVKDRIIARELDLVKVKGKTKPVRIYELIDLVNEEDLKLLRRPLQAIEQS